MPRNLEVKIPVTTLNDWKEKLRSLGAEFNQEVRQTDTYFAVARGRLKLREVNESGSELIYYEREETSGTRWSEYQVVPVGHAAEMKSLLSKAFGVKVVVEKRRQVYLYKQARIHLDEVGTLGEFLEFEVMEVDGSRTRCQELLDSLLERLSLRGAEKLRGSYGDLVLGRGADGP